MGRYRYFRDPSHLTDPKELLEEALNCYQWYWTDEAYRLLSRVALSIEGPKPVLVTEKLDE